VRFALRRVVYFFFAWRALRRLVHFSFAWPKEKRTKEKGPPAASPRLKIERFSLKRANALRFAPVERARFFTGKSSDFLHASPKRPELCSFFVIYSIFLSYRLFPIGCFQWVVSNGLFPMGCFQWVVFNGLSPIGCLQWVVSNGLFPILLLASL
jgi:hypothetical protein